MIITIDGPAASGKSTVGRELAQELGFFYVNSGILYRALAYLLMNKKGYSAQTVAQPDSKDLDECLDMKECTYNFDNQGEHFFIDDKEVTPLLKTAELAKAASEISANHEVRKRLTELQRTLTNNKNFVIDGRDGGAVVFPHAEFKFFLTAEPRVRAERWRKQQQKKGNEYTLDQALEIITERDKRDTMRKEAPLIQAEDAILIDNSYMTQKETLQYILKKIKTSQ